MKIGSSIGLIVLGAILAFALEFDIAGIDLVLVGYLLIAAGVIGLILTLILANRDTTRVSEKRSVVDPETGEAVTRTTAKNNGLNTTDPLL